MSEVVLIDDDAEVLEINNRYLSKEGYDIRPFTSVTEAIAYLKTHPADCVVMDVMMPDIDGFHACSKIRGFSDVPIIFLSGRTQEEDKVKGLLLGADDYIEKPYKLKELSVRIMVNIRRRESVGASARSDSMIYHQALTIDKSEHKAYYLNQEEIPLTMQEYDLLSFFASNPDKEITFEEIGRRLHGMYMERDRRGIMVSVSRLRKKLEDYPKLSGIIETVWSKGYCFRGGR